MESYIKTVISGLQAWVKSLLSKYALREEIQEALVQPDWNQNDPEAADYVKNRTHWKEIGSKEELPETAVEFTSDFAEWVLTTPLVEGDTYLITFDGVEYECIARNDGCGDIYVGNQKLSDGWSFPETVISDEPFFIATYEDWSSIGVAEPGTYTIRVARKTEVVHKIDPMYLPDYLYRDNRGVETIFEDTEVKGESYYNAFLFEIPCSLIEGRTYIVNWNGTEYECEAFFNQNVYKVIIGDYDSNSPTSSTDDSDLAKAKYPFYSNGDYFSSNNGFIEDRNNSWATIGLKEVTGDIVKVDEKFIPDTIARTADVIANPAIASVGQTIVVKAVDDEGKPTEWEAADLPDPLPTVTASDNGAFLRAVDGAWAAVQLTDVSTEGA